MGKTTNKDGFLERKCEFCSKSFTRANNLKKHIHTVHEGHKDYKCVFCGKSFTEAKGLKNHMIKIHEENRLQRL